MTVLYLNTSGQMGGAETSLLSLMKALAESHPHIKLILLLGEDGPFAGMARELGVHVLILPLPARLARSGNATRLSRIGWLQACRTLADTLHYRTQLLQTIRALRPDIIHSNGLKMHVLLASFESSSLGSHGLRLCHLHDSLRNRAVARLLIRLFARRFDCIVANSDSVAQELSNVRSKSGNVLRVYNGISPERFSPAGPQVDLDVLAGFQPPNHDVVRIGMVASFARWKGHTSLMRALALLPLRLPIRVYMVGGAIYRSEDAQYSQNDLKSQARQLCPFIEVGFTGVVLNVEDAYRALDLVVHASTEPEPFGMVLIEAMACGKAVLASRGGGVTEVIVDGENGLLHTPGDAATLAKHIEKLVLDADLRFELGRAGRATVTAHFQSKMTAARFAVIYDRMLTGSPRSALG